MILTAVLVVLCFVVLLQVLMRIGNQEFYDKKDRKKQVFFFSSVSAMVAVWISIAVSFVTDLGFQGMDAVLWGSVFSASGIVFLPGICIVEFVVLYAIVAFFRCCMLCLIGKHR